MAQSNIVRLPGTREAPSDYRSKSDTLRLTPEAVGRWKNPPFQREFRRSEKVMKLAEGAKAQ